MLLTVEVFIGVVCFLTLSHYMVEVMLSTMPKSDIAGHSIPPSMPHFSGSSHDRRLARREWLRTHVPHVARADYAKFRARQAREV